MNKILSLWSGKVSVWISCAFAAMLVAPLVLCAQQGNITTVAGGGPTTMPKLNGALNNVASTGEVGQIAWDASRQVFYFTSSTFHRAYKYDPRVGQATAIAGNGFNGFGGDGGDAKQASLAGPVGLVLDPTNSNFLYIADTGNNRVRRVNLSTNTVDTLFGSGTCNLGELTSTDVSAVSANLCAPGQMAMDGNGVLYVFDLGKSAVWRLASGQAHMIAGNGSALTTAPAAGGVATSMSLGNFDYLAVDAAGKSLYLNESFGLRQLNLTTGVLSAPLDLGATSNLLRDGLPVAVDPATGNVIYAIYPPPPPVTGGGCDPQTDPTCVSGGGSGAPITSSIYSYNPATGAKVQIAGQGSNAPPFLNPTQNVNLGVSSNGLGELVAIAPAGGAAAAFVASRSGWIHSMDSLSTSPNFVTILGNGSRSYCGDGGAASSACLDSPTSVSAAPDGTLYIVDAGNGVIRYVDPAGVMHSLVSPKAAGILPAAIAASPAGTSFSDPNSGNPLAPGILMFTSVQKHQIFVLDPAVDATTLYSGTGVPACEVFSDGTTGCFNEEDGGLLSAQYDQPVAIAIDSLGNPYVADTTSEMIFCLLCTDAIVHVAGGGSELGSGNPAQVTQLNDPVAVAVDGDNGLLLAQKVGHTVSRVNPDPSKGYVYPFNWQAEILTDVMTASSMGTSFSPVGVTGIPGRVLASDAGSGRVMSAVRPGNACGAGSGAQQSNVFAGGGTKLQDNIPATQAAFGSKLVEAGVFNPADGLGQIASSTINHEILVYITDRANNRIRAVDAGVNHPPVANAGLDRTVTAGFGHAAEVILDGSASTDPDCDLLQYTWSESGSSFATGATTDTFISGAGKHTITLTVSDGYGGVSTAIVNITVFVPGPNLAIAVTSSAPAVNAGDNLSYGVTVTNTGDNANNVQVAVILSDVINLISSSAPGGTCTSGPPGDSGSLLCPVGALAKGSSANFSITIGTTASGSLNANFTVSSDQNDADSSDNTATVITTVDPPSGGGGGSGPGGGGGSSSCNCTSTGNYVDPAEGADVSGDPLASATNKYSVTASIDNTNNLDTLTVTRHSDGKVLIPGIAFPITVHWGFSPDEDRIAIHAVDIGTQEDEIWVYDLSVVPAKQVVHYRLPVVSDRLQFSPSGQYFLLMALVSQGRTEIDIYRVAGVSTEDRVFQYSYPFQTVPGSDEDTYGATNWGFSSDRPETSFVFGYLNGQSTTSLNIANLAAPQITPGLSRNLTTVGAFWQFNPCGNLLGVQSQPDPAHVEVDLFNTSDGTAVGKSGETFGVDFVVFSSTSSGEQATVGFAAPVQIATNPACAPNTPTGSNITISAVDATTGTSPISVTFSSVTQAGNTSVATSSNGNPPPAGFAVGNPAVYYEVATTAVYSGNIRICISYAGLTFTGSPQIFHFVNGAWVNSTSSTDATHMIICGSVTSLSPFALFQAEQAPALTSANASTFMAGALSSFTASASGVPTPTLSESGALPFGVSFTDNGDGTASLKGTPSSGGAFNITITASNAEGSVSQSFTLTVNQSPTFTSPNNATFTAGSLGAFSVTASGFPSPTFNTSGALPSGVTLNSATGSLSGTPGNGGIFSFTITASNAAGSVSQSFTLTVNQPPAITSANTATFTVKAAGSFTVKATGFPAPTLSDTGTLPSGVTFNSSTGVLSGLPTAGGTFNIIFTAGNVAGSVSQSFILTVNQAPAVTSANSAAFTTGTLGSFTVTATGFPIPGLTETGALPGGVSFIDNHNGTGTLSGTPASSGTFAISFAAANGVGSAATQSFTLTVTAAAGGATLTVTPTSINFGSLHLLHLGSSQVTLQNTGNSAVTINSISLSYGPHTLLADFFFLSSCKPSLAVGKSCVIDVLYFADDLGPHTATLNIKDSASNSPQSVSLTGTAIK